MRLLIFIFCVLLELSISIPLENESVKTRKPLHSQMFFQSSHENRSSNVINHHEPKLISLDKKEYIFLSDLAGKVIIIGATPYEEVISYRLPEISHSITAILHDTFYNIDTVNGTIHSTNVGNLLEGPDNITWVLDGEFPKETSYIRSNPAVNGSIIYFVTYSGVLYSYNTKTSITYKVGNVETSDSYASLAVADKILYIHKYTHFYSFNGKSVKELTTSETRVHSGLFQQGNEVCRVGGNNTNVNPDPVSCYNSSSGQWSVKSHIYYARRYPGVVTIGLRTYIFGGQAWGTTNRWLDSVEVLNHETNLWGFFPYTSY